MKPAPTDPPELENTLWEHTQPGYMAWDIGANCGQTLSMLTRLFQRVVAFEPALECDAYLAGWPERANVHVLPYAISDHVGYIDLAELPGKIDTGQLVTPGTFGMEWSPALRRAVNRTVACYSIDSLVFGTEGITLDRPDFVKVDTEGHEGFILDGAAQTIQVYRPQWLIEFHTPELYTRISGQLREAGYTVHTVRHPHYPPGSAMYHQHGWLKAFPDR